MVKETTFTNTGMGIRMATAPKEEQNLMRGVLETDDDRQHIKLIIRQGKGRKTVLLHSFDKKDHGIGAWLWNRIENDIWVTIRFLKAYPDGTVKATFSTPYWDNGAIDRKTA